MDDVKSCAIDGDTFSIIFAGSERPFDAWLLLEWETQSHAIYAAGQAAAWCAENLDLCRTDFITWAAGIKVRAIDSGRKPTAATAIMESSDQHREHQRLIARAERMRRIAVALDFAVKYVAKENDNA